jgi:hypothetical protein
VYPELVTFFRSGLARRSEMVISFEDVELVTPSFLDETIVRLVREEPNGEVTLHHISDFPIRSLVRMLRATGKNITVSRVDEGVYRVAKAA